MVGLSKIFLILFYCKPIAYNIFCKTHVHRHVVRMEKACMFA
jgi:hypothetical protein